MGLVAFVPARAGSKRLTDKNVRMLAGKPLVIWTLEACIQSSNIDKVIFSTDSDAYWSLAVEHFGTEKLVRDVRTPEEAGDHVKIFDYLKLASKKIFGDYDGQFLMALPTMPFRDVEDVDRAIEFSQAEKCSVFSAVEYDFAVSFAFSKNESGDWLPVFESSPMVTGNSRSQDQITAFHPNGAIYIRSVSDLSDPGVKTIYTNAKPFIMERRKSVDIDTAEDFAMAEAMLRARFKED